MAPAALRQAASLRRPDGCAAARAAQRSSCCSNTSRARRIVVAATSNPSAQAWPSQAAAALVAGSLLLGGFSCVAPQPAHAGGPIAVLEGRARIVDGDTLYIGSEKIRLFAIDAPEKAQTCSTDKGRTWECGVASLQALKERVGDRPVRCEVRTKDQYGRNVAACSIAPSLPFAPAEDMGSFLVQNGLAVAYRAYGKAYVLIEEQARREHRGIWQGEFVEPRLWRAQQKAASLDGVLPAGAPAPPTAASGSFWAGSAGVRSHAAGAGQQPVQQQPVQQQPVQQQPVQQQLVASCNHPLIKGNINSKGQRIFHTPSSGQYARVEIDESTGERFFCSEEEALAAGWRSARR